MVVKLTGLYEGWLTALRRGWLTCILMRWKGNVVGKVWSVRQETGRRAGGRAGRQTDRPRQRRYSEVSGDCGLGGFVTLKSDGEACIAVAVEDFNDDRALNWAAVLLSCWATVLLSCECCMANDMPVTSGVLR